MAQSDYVSTPDSADAIARAQPRRETVTARAWRRFRVHRLAIISSMVLSIIVLLTVAAPLLAPDGPNRLHLTERYEPPSREWLLGTDKMGRSVWARVLYGGRVSLSVGLVIVAIMFSVGTLLGTVSGYAGGRVDNALERVMEIFNSLPGMIIVITITAIMTEPNIYLTMATLGFLWWPSVYRFVRGQVLSIREEEYVLAARCIGARLPRLLLRHVFPNVVPYLIVQIAFALPRAILTETSLSFLGLGVRDPTPSWGNIVGAVRSFENLENRPWMWLPAGFMITVTVLCINFIGDALRDALDPRVLVK